jgi:ubiquinone/menaquinone biosynthesis C-methylase UbiE
VSLNRPQDVREQYADSTKLTARADLHARFSTNPYGWNRWAFDRFDLARPARVLEVGGGPAWLWRTNVARLPDDWKVVSTDLSAGMATEAMQALDDTRFRFVVTDAQVLSISSETFDVVVANHMLYHVQDLDVALTEFARVLRPGGELFAATNGHNHIIEIRDLLEAVGLPRSGRAYIDAFGLESGPEAVRRYFDEVTVERYDDALEVTEVEPVIAYIASMMSPVTRGLDGERMNELRRRIGEQIARTGAFHIQKDAGLIRATRR